MQGEKRYVQFTGEGDGDCDNPSVIHLEGPGGTDFTVCGITMDGDPGTAGPFVLRKRGPVTCPGCIEMIKRCRGARFKE